MPPTTVDTVLFNCHAVVMKVMLPPHTPGFAVKCAPPLLERAKQVNKRGSTQLGGAQCSTHIQLTVRQGAVHVCIAALLQASHTQSDAVTPPLSYMSACTYKALEHSSP